MHKIACGVIWDLDTKACRAWTSVSFFESTLMAASEYASAVAMIVLALQHTIGAWADTPSYPAKPLRIVTGPAGGGNDIPARFIAQSLAASFGQPVIVDNRPAGVMSPAIVA